MYTTNTTIFKRASQIDRHLGAESWLAKTATAIGVYLALFARFDWHRSTLSVTHDHRKVAQFGNIYLFFNLEGISAETAA